MKFLRYNCYIVVGKYENEAKAIQLFEEGTHELVATATVNVPGEIPNKGNIFVKDYSENEGMTKALIEAEMILISQVRIVNSGFVSIGEYKLTEKGLSLFK